MACEIFNIFLWNLFEIVTISGELDYEIVNIINESFVKLCIFLDNGMRYFSFSKSIWCGIVYFLGELAYEIVDIVDELFVKLYIIQVNGM